MNWVTHGHVTKASGYQIYRDTRGFSCWVFGKKSGCLGRDISTLDAAKRFCEKHKASQREAADAQL